jgi:hypothetical protein
MAFARKWKNHTKDTRSTYQSWQSMLGRCYSPDDISFKYYGGRGIEVCDRWREDYDAFYEDMGPKPDKFTLDRINNDLGYFPENCQWSDITHQNRNKRSNRKITIGDETKTLAEWAKENGISWARADYRLKLGLSPEEAISIIPLRAPAKHGSLAMAAHRCRCSLCLTAKKEYDRSRYARKRDKGIKNGGI